MDAPLERLDGVLGPHGQPVLQHGGAGVEFRCDHVHRGAVPAVAGLEHSAVRVKTRVAREQGRVNVEDAALAALDERGAQDAHEAREHEQVRPVRRQDRREFLVVLGPVLAAHGAEMPSIDARRPCSLEPARVGATTDDGDDLGPQLAGASGVDEGLQIAALTRNQDGNTRRGAHATSPAQSKEGLAAIIGHSSDQGRIRFMRLPSAFVRGAFGAALAVLVGLAGPSSAATFPNLYRVTVTPDPAASDQRLAALQAAMARLLIRVTGNRNAPLDPLLQPVIADPTRFFESYGLDRQGQAQVGFRQSPVEQALTALGLPVWGPERPLTLLWIAVDDGAGGRALLAADETAALGSENTPTTAELLANVREEITATADERGLLVTFPLLDLEDLNAVTFADVWGGFEDRVVAASRRYGADAVLIGRVRPSVFGTQVEWLFVNGNERQLVPGVAVRDGLDAAADRYAGQFATIGGASWAAITVTDVATSADYARVISYLERQSVLQRVDVESFRDGVLVLRVAARGEPQVLERVLTLGGVLRSSFAVAPAGSLVFEVVRTGSSR